MNYKALERSIYKLYVFFLPFDRFIEFPFGDFINSILISFSSLLMLLGMVLIIYRGWFYYSNGIRVFCYLCIFMTMYSFIISLLLHSELGVINGEDSFTAIRGDIILYFLALASIYYNYYNLSYNVNFNQLKNIFKTQIIILLIIGYLQLASMSGYSLATNIYTFLSSFLSLKKLEYLVLLDRGVTLFGSEPASVSILCFIIIPYTISQIYCNRKRFGYLIVYVIIYVLFAILFLLSNSTQALISFLVITVVGGIIILRHNIHTYIYILFFSLGLFMAILYSADSFSKTSNMQNKTFAYTIYGKLLDRSNQSTAMRVSTIINDMKVFYENPILGVGNGNQGFFYNKNLPAWTLKSGEVQTIRSGKKGIVNGGGNFFPAYISAFGLVGIIVIILFTNLYIKQYKKSFLQNDINAKIMFQLGIILFLISSWYVVGVKQNETILFLLSLPCVISDDFNQNKKITKL
ncbi:O-antigen ligase family protein [Bacteroides sp. 224]|uniref:O-antigen ligase family protein n=1 Tax=Bacteroides sp. 224 TaxID=2302936 RepID=UPI0013D4EB23|nr:O-antigen ligase family protein [Bacteroides sp. 224]NDV66986.1 hypothetical protein [Bacteroides sp. 224]